MLMPIEWRKAENLEEDIASFLTGNQNRSMREIIGFLGPRGGGNWG